MFKLKNLKKNRDVHYGIKDVLHEYHNYKMKWKALHNSKSTNN